MRPAEREKGFAGLSPINGCYRSGSPPSCTDT